METPVIEVRLGSYTCTCTRTDAVPGLVRLMVAPLAGLRMSTIGTLLVLLELLSPGGLPTELARLPMVTAPPVMVALPVTDAAGPTAMLEVESDIAKARPAVAP